MVALRRMLEHQRELDFARSRDMDNGIPETWEEYQRCPVRRVNVILVRRVPLSCVLRLASCVLRLASCVLRLASCVLRLASCV
jgi:hypothetical protein